MADRLTLIIELGALATEATLRGDDRAVVTLLAAAEMLFADKRIDKVRQGDRQRKAEQQRIPRNPPESTGFHGGSQGFPPTPPLPNSPKSPDNTAREEREAAGAVYAESVDNLIAMLTDRVGLDDWPDVDGFLKRRPFMTWKGWLKEMLTVLTGGPATVTDLAQVCRDDAALDRPIASPKGLRTFVGSAVRERMENTSRPPAGAARAGPTSRRDTKPPPQVYTYPAATDPDEGPKWQN